MGQYSYSEALAAHARRVSPDHFFAQYDPAPARSEAFLHEKERREAAERAAEEARRDFEARATNTEAAPDAPVPLAPPRSIVG